MVLTALQRDYALVASLVVAGATGLGIARLPMARGLRPLLVVFNGFYILTSVIGASLIADDDVFALWRLIFPSMDAGWVDPGGDWLYWIVVLGPLVVTNTAAICLAPWLGSVVERAASRIHSDPAFMPCAIVAIATVGYCVVNLALHGYLGVGLFDSDLAGAYRANIQMRAEMMATLGDMHYGLVYMGIPAICVVALQKAVETRAARWWMLFAGVSGALVLLYLSTLTKGNLLVFGVALVLAAYMLRIVALRGLVLAGLAGILLLAAQEALLSGGSAFALARTMADVIFRISSGIPFYLGIFPEQHQYVGIDLGLGFLGIGPRQAANLIVADRMFPMDTWVQGAVPAPAHVVAYAQGGLLWSLATMLLVGAMIAAFAGLGRGQRNAFLGSAYIGTCLTCYNATQTDAVGVFLHSYGLRWWAAGLAAILVTQKLLEWAGRGAASAAGGNR